MVEELLLAGADVIKVGIGSGSVCTTRIKQELVILSLVALLNVLMLLMVLMVILLLMADVLHLVM
jgi:hypothetical protein